MSVHKKTFSTIVRKQIVQVLDKLISGGYPLYFGLAPLLPCLSSILRSQRQTNTINHASPVGSDQHYNYDNQQGEH